MESNKTDLLKSRKAITALLTIVTVCLFGLIALLRLYGTDFGFPMLTHFDEPFIVNPALKIAGTSELNPHFFNYPSFYIYVQSICYWAASGLGALFGTPLDLSETENTTFYLIGRTVSVLFAVATIFFVYLSARKLGGFVAAFCAVIFIGVSFLHVKNSFYIAVDSPMTFWVVLAFYMSVLILTEGQRTRYYIAAAVFVGAAVGTKYTGYVSILPLLAAHLFTSGKSLKTLVHRRFLLVPAVAALAFVLTTPFALLDYNAFINDVIGEFRHYSRGHVGSSAVGLSYGYYLDVVVEEFGLFQLILAGVGAVALLAKDRKMGIVTAIYPLVLFLFVGRFKTHFSRNILSALPFLAILGGCAMARLSEFLLFRYRQLPEAPFWERKPVRRLTRIVVLFLFLSLVSGTVAAAYDQFDKSYQFIVRQKLPDTRWLATVWINEHLPKGAKIGLEHYTPRPDEDRFRVKKLGKFGLLRRNKGYLKCDYFVASSSDYGRFFKDPEKFETEVRKYNEIFKRHQLLKTFQKEKDRITGPTIKIFKNSTNEK